MTALPLTDVTVLEMGSSVAGPFGTRILAEMGARVIKVESPGAGDPARNWGGGKLGGKSAVFQAFNKEKQSVVVDFSDAEALSRLKQLMSSGIDIVVQNLRPGVTEKFGLDAKTMVAATPRLIYCNVGAYGNQGPLRNFPGYDPLMQAFGGVIDVTGEPGRQPVRAGVPLIDLGTGMWAVIGVLSALHRRDVSGAGGIVDAAMLDTAVAWNNLGVALLEAGDEIPRRLGLQGGLLAPNGAYQTADGLLMMTVGTDPQFSRLCDVMQKSEVASDPRFADNAARVRNHGELKALMDDALGQNTRAYWWEKLCAADVPCAPIQSIEEMIEHPQILANDVVQRSPDDGFRLVGLPLKFDGERPAFRNMAPDLGAQTEAVFGRFSDQGGD